MRRCVTAYVLFFPFAAETSGQTMLSTTQLLNTSTVQPLQLSSEKGLFDSDDALNITLSGNLRPLLNDRKRTAKQHNLTLSYKPGDSSRVAIPVVVKARGHFRRTQGNCIYPPLEIKFSRDDADKSSIFKEQKKLKVVMPCYDDDTYVVREWLVYKLYNLITPKSFKTRLVKITLKDDKSPKTSLPFYGILIEEEDQLAQRNQLSR